MSKIISFGYEYKIKTKTALDLVYELVASTLGPGGTNLTLDRAFSVPITTNDGVSIARDIEVDDDIERQGVEMIKEVALRTNEEAGDGTTTSIVLAHALVEEGLKYNDNPLDIRRSLEQAKNKVVEELKKLSIPLKSKKQLLDLAMVSTESEEMGEIITDTINEIGWDGVISVEENRSAYLETSIVKGYEVEKGYVSSFMATGDNKAEFTEVKVLVIGERISNIMDILPLLDQMLAKGIREFVIFCVDIDNAVLGVLAQNKIIGNFKCAVVKAHSQNNEILEDVSIITGAKYIGGSQGIEMNKAGLDCLGEAGHITSKKDKTLIQKGKGDPTEKVKELKVQLLTTKNDNEYDLIEKRIARLNSSIAVISVGARTETEMRDKYYKIEDGVNAVKSAIEEGIVEGGGMTLYKLSECLKGDTVGEKILRNALKAPFKKIVENCGKDYAQILLHKPQDMGYDAKNDMYVDMIKGGIIDPTKVARCAIENSVSFAGTFLTSRGAIAVKKERPKE